MVNIIVGNGSTYNLVSAKVIAALKLPTTIHEKPYNVGWIRTGDSVKVSKQCLMT